MFVYTRIQMTQRTFFRYASWLLPTIAGCIMALASIATWYSDPLGGIFSAWQLPIDIDWQFHSGFINYGLLCCLSAGFVFMVALANWKPFKGSNFFVDKGTLAGLLCLVPITIFLFQYIIADPVAIDHISQHEIQLMLIQRHFTYGAPLQLIQIYPLATNSTTVLNRISSSIRCHFYRCLSASLERSAIIQPQTIFSSLTASYESETERLHFLAWDHGSAGFE